MFICQSCNTKYTLEEAKKIMLDGAIEVVGVVHVDTTSELRNLYEIARRATDNNNNENALKYYDMILVKDPSSWEANFYSIYFKAMSCKIAEIQTAAMSVCNCIESVLNLVKKNVTNAEEQQQVIIEIGLRVAVISEMLYDASTNYYNDIDSSIRHNYIQEYVYNVFTSTNIMYILGDRLVDIFGDTYGGAASESWKRGITLHNGYMKSLQDKESNKNIILQYAQKIKKYDANYQTPEINTSSSGCYIATAIYGSYDCPEVWTLRRFRDYTLAETWYGRSLIKTYYKVSPTIVKWFGKTEWFNRAWRILLDNFIRNLRKKGVDNTPYSDKR